MTPRILLITCFTLLFTVASGQDKKLPDDVYQVIPTLRGEALSEYFATLKDDWLSKLSYEEGLTIAHQVVDYCTEHKLYSAQVYAHMNVGRFYFDHNHPLEAIVVLQQAVELAQAANDSIAQMHTYELLGDMQSRRFLYNDAIKNLLAASELSVALKDTIAQFRTTTATMSVLFNSGNTEMAIQKGHEVIALFRALNDKLENKLSRSAITTLNTVAMGYAKINQYDSAIRYYNASEALARKYNNQAWIGLVNGNRAMVFLKLKRYPEALQGLNIDIQISKKERVWGSAVNAHVGIADVYLLLKDRVKAAMHLDSARTMNKTHNLGEELPTMYWKSYSDLKYIEGNHAEGRAALTRYTEQRINDITRTEASKVANAISGYDLERKKNEIDVLKKSEMFQQQQINNQRWIIIAAVSALVLAILLALSFVYNYRKQKKTSLMLSTQRDELATAHDQLHTAYQNLETAQETLVRTEKMAFLGRLTAGVAHEVNTPLAAIKASTGNIATTLKGIRNQLRTILELVPPAQINQVIDLFEFVVDKPAMNLSFAEQRSLKSRCLQALQEMNVARPNEMVDYVINVGISNDLARWKELLQLPNAYKILAMLSDLAEMIAQNENIGLAVNRAAKILFALRTYSRSGEKETVHEIDLAENIETVLAIYKSNLKQIEIVREFDEVPVVDGNPEELSQIWTNLIHNALQAMEGKGKLIIRVAKHTEHEVKAEFIDNGPGISPENLKRVFEPFFTTKLTGEGTGLGLAIVLKIIEKHRGLIEVESELAKGALFRVILPVTSGGANNRNL